MSSDSFLKWMKIEDEFVQRDGFPLPLHSNLVELKFFHFSLWQRTQIAHNKHFQYQFGQSKLKHKQLATLDSQRNFRSINDSHRRNHRPGQQTQKSNIFLQVIGFLVRKSLTVFAQQTGEMIKGIKVNIFQKREEYLHQTFC